MAIRQTRIFVRSSEPQAGWDTSVLGRVIKPITDQYQASLRWFWFSRYVDHPTAGGDTDINVIPAEYKVNQHRSIRFRFEISDDQRHAFESDLRKLITDNDYAISDIRAYDKVGDTGNHRFLGNENRQAGRDVHRAELVTSYYQAISKLMIDALVGPDADGRYSLETNDNPENPNGSTFQSLMHLFSNITNVPSHVILRGRWPRDIY